MNRFHVPMTKEEDEKTVERILERVRKVCGFVPVTNQILSERPDLFIPYSSLSGAIFENETKFDKKTKHLLALAAAAAMGSEHCIRNQMRESVTLGATEEEVLEVLVIAAYMGMTRSQSYSFRAYAEQFSRKLE